MRPSLGPVIHTSYTPRVQPRSVLLLINHAKPEAVAALAHVRSLISAHARIVAELPADNTPLPPDAADHADLIVVLGGDGTLMGQSRRCVALGLPMLGVNLGKLGFMAEFDLDSLRHQAKRLFDGSPLLIQDRPMLRATITPSEHDSIDLSSAPRAAAVAPSADGALARSLALNDAVITAGPPYRMIAISIRIDGHAGPTVTGDGLVVSTPIGSTAYNASLGGPIISPDVPALVLSPIAPQSLSFRPVVVPLTSTIELVLDRVNDQPDVPGLGGGSSLVLDGQLATRLRQGQRVTIRTHERPMRFVRNPDGSYWSTLIHKMRWATPPAARA